MTLEALLAEAVPSYEIGEEIGRGSFGVVFDGVHRRIGRRAAIKALALGFAADDPAVRARFATEASVLATLDHPNIVRIYDYVEHEGLCVLVMEHVSGATVQDHFAEVGMTWPASCAVMTAICEALQHAHDEGMLHRDVKPANVLVSDQGAVKVIDFGIARVIGGANSHTTYTGQLLGTPAYMAPEQIRPDDLTAGTDVYCAGTMFYELLCGSLPHPEDSGVWAMLTSKLDDDALPLPLRDADVPIPLAEVAMTAIARDPRERFPSARALGTAIDAAAETVWGPAWRGRAEARLVPPVTLGQGESDAGADGGGGPGGPRRIRPVVSAHVDGRFAVAVHEVYQAWRALHEPADDASIREWDDLDESLKASSLAQADDIFVKLRAIGCTVHPVFGREVRLIEFALTSWRTWHRRSTDVGSLNGGRVAGLSARRRMLPEGSRRISSVTAN